MSSQAAYAWSSDVHWAVSLSCVSRTSLLLWLAFVRSTQTAKSYFEPISKQPGKSLTLVIFKRSSMFWNVGLNPELGFWCLAFRLEIMETMALHQESAYERLYRWTQSKYTFISVLAFPFAYSFILKCLIFVVFGLIIISYGTVIIVTISYLRAEYSGGDWLSCNVM